jgi:NitT/TauT family transport system ATP-binding protein
VHLGADAAHPVRPSTPLGVIPEQAAAQIVLQCRGISMRFGKGSDSTVALEQIDLDVARGEFLVLLGPSGCGKSTLLYLMAGLLLPTTGTVTMGGELIRGPSPRRGVVFQDFALFPWLTVEDNIRFGLDLAVQRHHGPNDGGRVVLELVKTMGLSEFQRHKPHQLSGGMRQRVAIARTLAPDPEVMLMDEPFGSLDAQTRTALQRELAALAQRTGKTTVFVTHSIEEAALLASRVVILSRRPGRIQRVLPVTMPRLRWNWKTEFPADYLQLVSDLEAALAETTVESRT